MEVLNNMKDLSRTKKILIVCILLNVLVFGAYAFLYIDIKSKNVRVSELLTEAENDMQKDASLRAIKTSLNENKEFISQIDSYFVPKNGVPDFIDTLEKLGKESEIALSIGSVSVEEGKNKNDFKDALHLHVDTIGSWQNIYYFLSVLESLPYRIQFDQVSVTLSAASESILFGVGPVSGARQKSANESWKGTFDIIVYKLR
jgi:Tfp pilus assembly protein PilO